jgi:YfiR/HmsC-like
VWKGRAYCTAFALVACAWLNVAVASAGLAPGPGSPQALPEYVLKAAFLYNFALFVQWPDGAFASAGEPVVVGIVGSDPFGDVIDRAFVGKTVDGRPLLVKRLPWGPELRTCHVLFVANSESRRIADLPALLQGAAVLTVADDGQAARRGSVIGFVVEDKKVGFDVYRERAREASLTISSQMLKLARLRDGVNK